MNKGKLIKKNCQEKERLIVFQREFYSHLQKQPQLAIGKYFQQLHVVHQHQLKLVLYRYLMVLFQREFFVLVHLLSHYLNLNKMLLSVWFVRAPVPLYVLYNHLHRFLPGLLVLLSMVMNLLLILYLIRIWLDLLCRH